MISVPQWQTQTVINLDQFALWYSQAGTPVLDAQGRLKDGAFELTIKQTIPLRPI